MCEELKRIFGRPMVYMLFIGCLLINLWVLWNYSGQRDLVSASREVADRLTDGAAGGFLQVNAKNSSAIANDLLRAAPEADNLSREINIPTVLQMVEGADRMAELLGPEEMATAYISGMDLKDGAADGARKVYAQLEPVMEKNREDGSARAFFVPCHMDFFEMFSGNLLPFLIAERIVCAVLLMINTANDSFSSKLTGLIFTCQKGRRVQRTKCISGLLAGLAFTATLWGVTIGLAAVIFPLGSLWRTPLGSMMVLDKFYPVIPWFSMSLIAYIGFQLLIALGCVALFSMAAYALVLRLHQSFSSFMILGFVSALIYTITWGFPKDSAVYLALQWNPVDLARKAGHWLVNGSSFMSPRFYEIGTFGLWAVALAAVILLVTRRFYREDL